MKSEKRNETLNSDSGSEYDDDSEASYKKDSCVASSNEEAMDKEDHRQLMGS